MENDQIKKTAEELLDVVDNNSLVGYTLLENLICNLIQNDFRSGVKLGFDLNQHIEYWQELSSRYPHLLRPDYIKLYTESIKYHLETAKI